MLHLGTGEAACADLRGIYVDARELVAGVGGEARNAPPLDEGDPQIAVDVAEKTVAGGDQQRRPGDDHRDRPRQRHALMALVPPLEAVKKAVLDVDPVERLLRAGPLR
jgi:hypothetical protein